MTAPVRDDSIPFAGNAVGIIPARCASRRFPDKPLALIAGIPMICWTLKNAEKVAGLQEVWVAAEDERVVDTVQRCGGKAMLVQGDFRSGSDRIAAAAQHLDAEVIVNIQGDEPLVAPAAVDEALRLLVTRSEFGITTLVQPFRTVEDFLNPNNVKVVMDRNQRCLYFSRAPIPARHRISQQAALETDIPYRQHIGIYCFRRPALMEFASLPESPLEKIEGLEQLRFLEFGGSVGAVEVMETGPGINSIEDLKLAEAYLSEHDIAYT